MDMITWQLVSRESLILTFHFRLEKRKITISLLYSHSASYEVKLGHRTKRKPSLHFTLGL